jgi:hypothetical protein
MPWLVSVSTLTFSGDMGACPRQVALQPVDAPGDAATAHAAIGARLMIVPMFAGEAGSVPFLRVTAYCSGVICLRHSSSVFLLSAMFDYQIECR